MPKFTPPPVPYREVLRLRKTLSILQSQWQALLEENHELRMRLKARPERIETCSTQQLRSSKRRS